MIQDIAPHRLDNAYSSRRPPREGDAVLLFDADGRILAAEEPPLRFPRIPEIPVPQSAQYLFSLDGTAYFLAPDCAPVPGSGYAFRTIRELRAFGGGPEIYAAFTAWHLWRWYADNRFCGRCGQVLVPDGKERALRCPRCGNLVFPRINPAVIVGVTDGDRILITRYARGFAHNALVAGFTEIGETFEETVAREVMEETGIRVKNVRYYKSQPWGMAQDILAGFFCEVDGNPAITMDRSELKYAEWVRREDVELQPDDKSLTNEMMKLFRDGKV